MSVISPTDFYNWKVDPVTTAFMLAVKERIENAREILTQSAGKDSNEDNYYRGYINGQRDILEVSIEDLEEQV